MNISFIFFCCVICTGTVSPAFFFYLPAVSIFGDERELYVLLTMRGIYECCFAVEWKFICVFQRHEYRIIDSVYGVCCCFLNSFSAKKEFRFSFDFFKLTVTGFHAIGHSHSFQLIMFTAVQRCHLRKSFRGLWTVLG